MKIRFLESVKVKVYKENKIKKECDFEAGSELVVAWVNDDLFDEDIIWCHLSNNNFFSVLKTKIKQ